MKQLFISSLFIALLVCSCNNGKTTESQVENNQTPELKESAKITAEYQVEFRSYTGAFVYFYVDKTSGATRMVEYVPNLDVKNEVGTINLFDYLKKE